MKRPHLVVFLGAAALLAPACGGNDATTIDVTLQEFAVVPSATTGAAGSYTFAVSNDGPDDTHEFVVFKTDLAITDLPVDENGAVDEGGEGLELIGEVEDVAVGAAGELTADLEAGAYVFVCNIWDEDEQEAHYTEGMRAAFTVT